ncbi:MAG: secretin N-terminal domain-containing protein [Verrucomicrobiota bacterium]
MSTRTPSPITLALLLAILPAARVLAQPAAPAAQPEAAPAAPVTPPPPVITVVPAPPEAPATSLADKPAEAPAPNAASVATKNKDATGRDTLTVDFPDEDIRNILRNVADLFELNIIMPEALQGKTTIKLRDVTWRQIFESVLSPVNYTFREEGNIIKIVSNESLQQEPTSTDVFLINYARASDILPTVTSLVEAAAGGRIVVDQRSNSLVITERPSRMNRIRTIIEQLDRATDQVVIESKFVEVTGSDVKDIGVNWASLSNFTIGASNINNAYTRERSQNRGEGSDFTDTTGLQTRRATTDEVRTTINNTQNSGSNSSNTVTSANGVPSIQSSTSTTGGIGGNTTVTSAGGTNNSSTISGDNALTQLLSLSNEGATSRALTSVFSASDFSIVLSALQTLQNTKVVSNPTIVTLNNTQAVINVGEERPIPSYTYNAERGTYEVSGFNYRPIGIILKVTPQVNGRGMIKLTVEPEVSQSTRDANFQGASIPIVESRKASTMVQIKDGYTMGIGGLMRSEARDTNAKVPVLGSIPVLGRLFSHKAKNHQTSNLIIFITAKTVSAEGAPLEQLFDSRQVRKLEMTRDELPGYRDGSSPFVTPPPPPEPKKKK